MTYSTCYRLIETKKKNLASFADEWAAFVDDMTNKLDVFLLNNRITDEQYNELIRLMQ